MMTDIVKRLRGCMGDSLEEEAADEIERLRAALTAIQQEANVCGPATHYVVHEIASAALNPKDSKDD